MFALRRTLQVAARRANVIQHTLTPTRIGAHKFHSVALELNPNASRLDHHTTTEFDGDAGEYVPKEVSIHDRRQSQLSEQAKESARLADYNGDRHSALYTSGLDPAKLFETYDPAKHDQAERNAIEEAESLRDA